MRSDWFIKHQISCAIHLGHSFDKKSLPLLLQFRRKKLLKQNKYSQHHRKNILTIDLIFLYEASFTKPGLSKKF